MNQRSSLLVPLFQQFIKESYRGRRLKADGSRIKPQTVTNYEYVLRYLREFELKQGIPVSIREMTSKNQRIFDSQKKYWRKFYESFTAFLYKDKGCFDNYVGTVIKTIRIFFNWLIKEKGFAAGEFYKNFYVCKEEVPIITLMPDQLDFLINDESFSRSLSKTLQKSKDIFVFGCTVALRKSDLFAIKFTDVQMIGGRHYLNVQTIKTNTRVKIKLPAYAVDIFKDFQLAAKKRKTVFPPIPPSRFNNHLKEIGEKAGWIEVMGKSRSRKGALVEQKRKLNSESASVEKSAYRFCDLLSSHTMRRTAITTMLMMGMKEHVVKQISGHAGNSKSFYRYINLVQPYLDQESELVWNRFDKTA